MLVANIWWIAKMNITPLPRILVLALVLSVAVTSPAVTQEVEEAPSTVKRNLCGRIGHRRA